MSGRMSRTRRSTAPAAARSSAARTDIQGLRALAVSLVLVFHLWPAIMPGGYVGVDVFFVVSGFLITGHLLREIDSSGTVSLPRFWARRARRLLPAALTVLVVTLVLVMTVVPAGSIAPFVRQIMASGLYVENWVLAAESVDYLAAEAAPSPVQHYWSLSAEEQFYLIWPLVVLLAVWLAARLPRRLGDPAGHRTTVVGIALGAVVVASFIWSVAYTAREPSQAYFVTTTRAWEFGIGGLLAVAVAAGGRWRAVRLAARLSERARVVVVWIGIVAIAVSAFAFNGSTPFPGWAALVPVLGAALVIAADDPRNRFGLGRAFALRPVQWLGDVSYSVYLWHWPLIVLLPYLYGRGLTLVDRIVVVVATLVLAALTTRLVEDPIRHGVPARWRPRAVLAATAAAMAVVTAASFAGVTSGEERVASEHERIEEIVSEQPDCLGAASLEPLSGCNAYATVLDSVVPDPALADDPPERCIAGTRGSDFKVCDYGAKPEDAVRTVALVGDSHAEQWMPALASIAAQREWRLYVLAKSSCPFSGAERFEEDMSADSLREMNDSCNAWNDDALAFLQEHPEIDTVLTASRSRNPVRADEGEPWQETAVKRYQERWAELPGSVANIVVLRDTPMMPVSTLACVAENGKGAAEACAVDEAEALGRDPMVEAARSSDDPRLSIMDLTPFFCLDGHCPPVVGGVLAFRDTHHISWVYAETLAPYVDEQLVSLIGEAPARPS